MPRQIGLNDHEKNVEKFVVTKTLKFVIIDPIKDHEMYHYNMTDKTMGKCLRIKP